MSSPNQPAPSANTSQVVPEAGIILAASWKPRGELKRLERNLELLCSGYAHLTFSLEPNADPKFIDALEQFGATAHLTPQPSHRWFDGRMTSIRAGLTRDGAHLHYADFDRLVRWVETRPGEWRTSLKRIPKSDMLIFGRSPQAFESHPQALKKTENIINSVFSSVLGPVDLGAGSRGLSRRAAVYLNEHGRHGGLGSDAEWPILLHRAGFALNSLEVDGLDWEHADHFHSVAA